MRITGLAKAPQHNGKVGKVSSKAAQEQGRVGVELGKGQTLSVRLQNLERAEEPEPSAVDAPMPAAPEGVQRTLQRDNAVLQEFDGSGDPNTLVLYHHLRDRAFDAFNAAEYNEQMLRYYAGGITVSEVVPRKMGDNDYLLVCLRNKVAVVAAAAAAGVAVGGWVRGWVGGWVVVVVVAAAAVVVVVIAAVGTMLRCYCLGRGLQHSVRALLPVHATVLRHLAAAQVSLLHVPQVSKAGSV